MGKVYWFAGFRAAKRLKLSRLEARTFAEAMAGCETGPEVAAPHRNKRYLPVIRALRHAFPANDTAGEG